ncbi:MAG: PASTA domain-containing protein, partial [Jiangellaceae bacterium]
DPDPSPTSKPVEICPPGTEGTPPDCTPIEPTPTEDPEVDVPNVIGKMQQQAEGELRRAGFQVAVETAETDQAPPGEVVDQGPPGGTTAPPGSTVTIVVAAEPDSVDVPDLSDMTRSQAEQALNDVGLVPNFMGSENPDGLVTGQDPRPGESVPVGSTVDVRIRDP